MMKKALALVLAMLMVLACLPGCGPKGSGETLRVYNWGEYIDEGLVEEFEAETGIRVIYDTFNTNEEMYPKIEADSSSYDVICPSEYMAQKMIKNDLVQPIDKSKLSNYGNLDEKLLKILSDNSDPDNKYLVPYCWGTVGILYNKTMVTEPVDSWSILWDEKYKGSILMQDSVRDAFMVAQKSLGYSMNTTDAAELEACTELLKEQNPLVKGYVIDEVRDKMIAGDTALGVIYSGEYLYCTDPEEGNTDLEYAIPKEGTNVWYDGWVITKGAKNVDGAHKFIDFLLRAEVAKRNFDYITYPTPNKAAKELCEDEIKNNKKLYPDDDVLDTCEMYLYLGEDVEDQYYEYWKTVK